MTLHRKRCETCIHHKLVGKIPDIDECEILDHTPTKSEMKFIEQLGCASHMFVPLEKEMCLRYRFCDYVNKWNNCVVDSRGKYCGMDTRHHIKDFDIEEYSNEIRDEVINDFELCRIEISHLMTFERSVVNAIIQRHIESLQKQKEQP